MIRAILIFATMLFLVSTALLRDAGHGTGDQPAARIGHSSININRLSRKKQCIFQLWGNVRDHPVDPAEVAARTACPDRLHPSGPYEESVALSGVLR